MIGADAVWYSGAIAAMSGGPARHLEGYVFQRDDCRGWQTRSVTAPTTLDACLVRPCLLTSVGTALISLPPSPRSDWPATC
jgi:hypothetical protein